MKKNIIKFILASCFLLPLVYTSCVKKNDIPNKVEELTVPFNKNGIAHFTTAEALFETINKVSTMAHDERNKWEAKMGFVSHFSLINSVLQKIEEAETEEVINAILLKNKDLLQLSKDDEIMPVLPSTAYSFVANKEGYFYVNNYLHKVTPEGVLISEIPGVTEINGVNDGVIMYKTPSNLTKGCGSQLSAPREESTRKVTITISTYTNMAYDGYSYYYQDFVDWTARGYKKVLVWVSLNTIYWHQNVNFTVYTKVNSSGSPEYAYLWYSFSSEQSPYEGKSFSWIVPVGNLIQLSYPATLEPPRFSQVHAEAKARGTTGWAKVDCY